MVKKTGQKHNWSDTKSDKSYGSELSKISDKRYESASDNESFKSARSNRSKQSERSHGSSRSHDSGLGKMNIWCLSYSI